MSICFFHMTCLPAMILRNTGERWIPLRTYPRHRRNNGSSAAEKTRRESIVRRMSWYSSMISPLQEGRRSWIQIFRSYDFGFYFRQIREEEQEKASIRSMATEKPADFFFFLCFFLFFTFFFLRFVGNSCLCTVHITDTFVLIKHFGTWTIHPSRTTSAR